MTVTITNYLLFMRNQFNGNALDFDGDTLKFALLTDSYTPDYDTHEFFSDLTNEVSGTGYTAGGATATTKLITTNTGDDQIEIDCDDPTWSTASLTARYAVLYKSTGTDSTSPLILCIDFGEDKSPVGQDLVLEFENPEYLVIKQGS